MTRKMFGLYRSYRLGVGDVFGLVALGLLVLAAISIAVFTTTTNIHPGKWSVDIRAGNDLHEVQCSERGPISHLLTLFRHLFSIGLIDS